MIRKSVVCAVAMLVFITSQSTAQETSRAFAFLKDLDVFTGTWEGTTVLPSGTTESERLGQVEGKKVTITQTSRWAPGKCARVMDTSFEIEGSETILGTTLIGWDQKGKTITTTQFTTHKGVWSGTIKREGNKWVFSYEGVNLDGKKGTGKRIVTFADDNHYTAEQHSTLDGEPQPHVTWQFKRL
jgi:hypothetical protein